MEQKGVLLSALGVGIGVGVGLGLASGETVKRWTRLSTSAESPRIEQIQEELKRLVLDGKSLNVTFDDFPNYLSEKTRMLLTNTAFVHLNRSDVSKYTHNLTPASRNVILFGPNDVYLQNLAKALAHEFKAKLLILDVSEFSFKMHSKHGWAKKESPSKSPASSAAVSKVSGLFGSFSKGTSSKPKKKSDTRARSKPTEPDDIFAAFIRNSGSGAFSFQPAPPSPAPSPSARGWCFDEKMFFKSLYKVVLSISQRRPAILYLRDVHKLLLYSSTVHDIIKDMLMKLPNNSILVLGSCVLPSTHDEIDSKVSQLFPYNIRVVPPEDEANMATWKSKHEEDLKSIQLRDNRNHVAEVLAAHDLECDDLASICEADTIILNTHIQEIILSAVSYHLMNNKDPEYRNGKLVISSKSLSQGINIFQEGKKGTHSCGDPFKILPSDNEFERRLRSEVIAAKDIGVSFSDIGALDEIKESLQEAVMLPLRRPDLFSNGLLKPCKGVLLFGPPGTGKTMLTKAIASEAGASFINLSMSTITSKWYGEGEKIVRAVFTLAAKVSPAIVFVDEVDSLLGQRSANGEHEASRRIKNEFMTHWDGLLTKSGERVLVLGATNRPFDLDEAIIRRFERRIMVGLPSAESREKILTKLLEKAKVENLDYKELAAMTEGFSGSDLKNLCVTAAYRPVRELIQKEKANEEEKKAGDGSKCSSDATDTDKKEEKLKEGSSSKKKEKKVQKTSSEKKEEGSTSKKKENKEEKTSSGKKEEGEDEKAVDLRSITMEDMREAKKQVASSFASEGSVMSSLKQWNELYGDGGSRKKEQLTYFL